MCRSLGSSLQTIYLTRAKVQKFESMLAFHHTYSIGRYLGFPLLKGRVTKNDFSYIFDKINGRLAGWKGKLLSKAGRVTLAKSVVSSMPIYTMQNLWFPSSACDQIDSTIRSFVWGSKSHWVRWSTTSLPRAQGGLGLRQARATNVSLLGKHVWDLLQNQDKLWVQLLSTKYLQQQNILTATLSQGASYTWRSIHRAAVYLKPGFLLRAGNGDGSFWYEQWLEKGPICNLVPFVSIHDINLRLRDVYHDGEWHFERMATQLPNDVQMAIRSIFLSNDAHDLLIWGPSKSGSYSAASGYKWLVAHLNNHSAHTNQSWMWIWNSQLPENLKFFLWLCMHDSLPSNQVRMAHHMTNDPSCPCCGAGQETLLHLLRDCSIAKKTWDCFGFSAKLDFKGSDFKLWISNFAKATSGTTFVVICWFIWKARNEVVFSDQRPNLWAICSKIRSLVDYIKLAFGNKVRENSIRHVQ